MKLRLPVALCALLASGGAALADGSSIMVKPKAAERFVTLPNDVNFPEGIAANPGNGDIYVATFDFGGPNEILRYSRKGKLLATKSGLPPLLGLEFNLRDNKLYIANFGASKIQRIAADLSGDTEDVALIPRFTNVLVRREGNPDGSEDEIVFGSNDTPGPNNAPNRAPNAMTFSENGDLYVSDSFQGAIFTVSNPATPGFVPVTASTFVRDGRLATAGFPPFGANGLAFNGDESVLYVANTGDDRVFQVDMEAVLDTDISPFIDSRLSLFAQSVNGADGLAFDKRSGLLWVAANQADEMVALNDKGRVVARLGAFLGFDRKRSKVAARGLLFPASPVIVGDSIFVTNLALPLTGTPDEPETEVNSYTISRIDISERDDDHDD